MILQGFIFAAFMVVSSHSVPFHVCDSGENLPAFVDIVGCVNKTGPCMVPAFSQPILGFAVNFITPEKLNSVKLEAKIDVKNLKLMPHVDYRWTQYNTEGPSLPLEENENVTFSSKIHYTGYEGWVYQSKDSPLNATATFKVKGDGDKVIYCAEVDLKFYECVSNCPELFEEYKNAKKPVTDNF